ncbi:MAG: dicarboxylate/amino acid:cation symporter, partial [Flavobacteriaceae bacterium]
MKKRALHWKILIGMLLGVLFGLAMSFVDSGDLIVRDFVKPFGTIFINLLKLIAIPLILASLIKGVSDLKDISKLSAMGGRTIGTYLVTTLVAVSIGLVLVNTIKPGESISVETRQELVEAYSSDADAKREVAA